MLTLNSKISFSVRSAQPSRQRQFSFLRSMPTRWVWSSYLIEMGKQEVPTELYLSHVRIVELADPIGVTSNDSYEQ